MGKKILLFIISVWLLVFIALALGIIMRLQTESWDVFYVCFIGAGVIGELDLYVMSIMLGKKKSWEYYTEQAYFGGSSCVFLGFLAFVLGIALKAQYDSWLCFYLLFGGAILLGLIAIRVYGRLKQSGYL